MANICMSETLAFSTIAITFKYDDGTGEEMTSCPKVGCFFGILKWLIVMTRGNVPFYTIYKNYVLLEF